MLAIALGVFLVVVGTSHFVLPSYFVRLVPPWLPRPLLLVFASGGVEVVLGVGLWIETTRQLAAGATTILMATYVLTHVDALLRASSHHPRWLDRPAGGLARVVVNILYVAWAAAVTVAG